MQFDAMRSVHDRRRGEANNAETISGPVEQPGIKLLPVKMRDEPGVRTCDKALRYAPSFSYLKLSISPILDCPSPPSAPQIPWIG